MIRAATLDDMPDMLRLGALMHAESRYASMTFAPEVLAETIAQLIASPYGFAWVAIRKGRTVGVMLAGVGAQWFSRELTTFEYGVYVEPDCRGGMLGISLIKSYKKWALSVGARIVQGGVTANIEDGAAGKIYERIGFDKIGSLYAMEV